MQSQLTTRSELFTAYNAARALTREGRIDTGRLNRALGLAQSHKSSPYTTTMHSCDCPDSRYRVGVCKHRLAKLLQRAGTQEAVA